jgi:hypothetical protein
MPGLSSRGKSGIGNLSNPTDLSTTARVNVVSVTVPWLERWGAFP